MQIMTKPQHESNPAQQRDVLVQPEQKKKKLSSRHRDKDKGDNDGGCIAWYVVRHFGRYPLLVDLNVIFHVMKNMSTL